MRLALVGIAALLIAAAPAGAAPAPLRPVRAAGFSIGVPVGWQTIRDVGSLKLMAVVAGADGGFRTNFNVVVTESPAGSIEGMRRELRRELPKTGIRVSSLTTRVVWLPAGRALEVRYRGTMLGRRLAWLAYVLEARGRAYVLTFTASQSRSARYAPTFRAIARSFRLR